MPESPAEHLAARIRDMMCRAGMRPGERLGDERALAADLNVTRSRLREALVILEAERAVRRRIGRSGGVFASDGRIERNINTIEGLPEITRVQGINLATTVLRLERIPATPGDRRTLRVSSGDDVYHLQRLRNADGTGLSLEDTRLPAAVFPGLEDVDVTSLYRTMRFHYGVEPQITDESVEVGHATEGQAELLGVATGSALVRLSRVTLDAYDRPIEAATELFVADRIRLHLRRYGVTGNSRRTSVRVSHER